MGQLVNSTDLSPVFEISDALLLNGVELDGAAVWVAKVLKKKIHFTNSAAPSLSGSHDPVAQHNRRPWFE